MSGFGFDSTAEDVTEGLDLSGQRWLVTGVNSGLGFETARVLSLRGAHIVGLARTAEKATAALAQLGGPATAVACELSDLSSVRSAVGAVDGPLDGIIANAGIMALPELRQQDGVELQFFTNHVGHFVLVNGLVGQLTPAGRVVILSSSAHYNATGLELDNLSGEADYQPWRMYGRSKLANILYASALARRLAPGQTANSLHPGVIRTNLARHVPNAEGMFARLQKRLRFKTVAQGAATQCYVATHPELASVSGQYFSDCAVTPPASMAEGADQEEALWAATVALVS
jgi:WW domain-containing oxidoreductase